jgi:predicted alpha/beta-hydrolase family hydrolase
VPTPLGDARLLTNEATRPVVTLVLGHGASGGAGSPDLVTLASVLPELGVTVVRMEQPWRVAGRRTAAPPASLDRAWLSVLQAMRVDGGLLVGGRSAGARVACRTAVELGATGVLALAFPLHPPGRPDRSRLSELRQPLDAGIATVVVQGERDAFGRPGEFPPDLVTSVVRVVPGATHALTGQQVTAAVLDQVSAWLRESVLLGRR